jgi:hypothetical protein
LGIAGGIRRRWWPVECLGLGVIVCVPGFIIWLFFGRFL